jgi:hypothetical protein
MKAIRIRLWHVFFLMILVALALALVSTYGLAKKEMHETSCRGNFSQIYVHLLNLRDSQGRYPPAVSTDADGRPMHSWRAQVYAMARGTLGREYDLMQPWDSPANRKAAQTVPPMFVCGNNQSEPARFSNYVVIIDRGQSTLDRASAIPKGSPDEARQILVIEDPGSVVRWTEPRDLDSADLPKLLVGADPHGIGVLFADGTFRRMKREQILMLYGR